MKKQIEVFRSGTFKSMSGADAEFSQQDVDAVAEIYDPTTSPAPVVVGHPKDDSPAYGWASAFSVNDKGVLVAEVDQLDEGFVEAVNKGRYKNISMSFFTPDAPANPKQGFYYPKHIGFLGGAAPAVSGLAPVTLSDGSVAINFTVMPFDGADHVGFCASPKSTYNAREVDRIKEHYENEKRIDDLIRSGKLLPIHGDGALEFIDSLDSVEVVAFADGTKQTQKDWFLNFIDSLPTLIEFGELADTDKDSGTLPPNIHIPRGVNVDPDDVAKMGKIEAYAREKNLSFSEAAIQLSQNA